jgi:hypothetical protein
MPVAQTILSGPDLTLGLRNTFRDAYMFKVKQHPYLTDCMDVGLPTDGRYETYSYPETAPYPTRWAEGESVSSDFFKFVQFSCVNYRYGKKIQWQVDDRLDGKTQSLFEQAQQLGEHFGTLIERFFFEYVNGTAILLPNLANAPDGLALYSSSTRFGTAGGNTLAGGGVATAAAVRTNYWLAYARATNFKDTQSQPLFQNGELDTSPVILFNPALTQVMGQAFMQSTAAEIVRNAAATENVAAAGVENLIKLRGLAPKLWCSQRVTSTTAMYVFWPGVPHKPLFEQRRMDVQSAYATEGNSDSVRETDIEYVRWKSRHGVGAFLPYGTVSVT